MLTVFSAGPLVKKETLITALVFLGIGFLAGYVYKAQKSLNPDNTVAAAQRPGRDGDASQAQNVTASPSSSDLPPGHPPIDNGAIIQTLEQQSAANPQDPAPPLKLADYFYDQGEFEQAIGWYQKALKLNPKDVNASTDLGTCYFNLGRPDDALRQFHNSLTIEPRHQPTLYNIVVVLMEGKHDYKAARQAWGTLHRLNPDYPNLDRLKQRLDEARAVSAP